MGPRSFDRGDQEVRSSIESLVTLQWGRGPLTAETAPVSPTRSWAKPLQWGRGPLTAETSNGKGGVANCAGLQWGRGPLTAETLGRGPMNPTDREASMGPRSFDRGDNLQLCMVQTEHSQLQWGRGPLTAETEERRHMGFASGGLQWGRGPLTAETSDAAVTAADQPAASMGPRSFDRGDRIINV